MPQLVHPKAAGARSPRGKALIAEHGAAVDAWLATCDQPYEGEAAAFFWLRQAGEEL